MDQKEQTVVKMTRVMDEYIRLINQVPMITGKKWDYLIVLDGCRYDTFKEVIDIPGTLIPVWSPEARTKPWMDEIFSTQYQPWDDVIVVSGSQYSAIHTKKFKKHRNCFLKDWDEEEGTISGKNVTQAALRELVGFPNDKMIIWYMQPHVPFIGERRIGYTEIGIGKKALLTIEGMVRHPNFTRDYVYEAYKDNLKYVLFHVKELLRHLHGSVIITSDHGNGFGENNYYGHENAKIVTKFLREVPWFEVDLEAFRKLGENDE